MNERIFVTFLKEAKHQMFTARDGSAIAMIVTSKQVGFQEWATGLARDFCDSETLIIPDSPDGWEIHAEYLDGVHRMHIILQSMISVQATMSF